MSSLPSNYNIDFVASQQDLQTRSVQRLLRQFQNSPVLLGVLGSIVAEIQELSNAIVAVQQAFSLAGATGDVLTTLGALVGVTRANYSYDTNSLATEGGADILTEDGQQIEVNTYAYDLSDFDMLTKIRVKIASNFTRNCSIPEITQCVLDIVGVAVKIIVTGPSTMQILVPTGTSTTITDLLMYTMGTTNSDKAYLFPYPALTDISIGYY